ncbi:MAG: divergent polysaccharide deacetylase family protein [Alphaproteobacteria bacterium]|nr:MAG: divergent polysaccharide deacetylase family protein [Alphaproteobacteria bacterium]
MAGLNRGMKVLIGAWALAVLVLGGIFIWLALAEPARPPGLDQGAVARAVVDLRGHPPAEGVAIAKPAPASVPTGPAPALPADPVVPAPAAPDQADAPPAALPAAAVPPDAEKPRIYDPAELSEDGPYGPLPRVAPNGLAPYQAYSAAFDAPASMPRIAVVITGLGLSATLTQKALARLPATVTLAFSPYGYDLATWASQARVKGHELLVMVPMEPLDYPANDPGPHVLMKDATVAANLDRLYFVLSRFQGFVGVVNAMGSRITANETAMRPVLGELKARGLMFVDSRSTAFTVAARMAQEMGLRWAINNRFLDQSPTGSDIRDALSELEGRARSLGAAVGLARALPLSIDSIADWAATAAERGIAIAPITAVANAQPVR